MNPAYKKDDRRLSTRRDSECSFCGIAHGDSLQWIDMPVCESENFVAIPSLGSITPGWIMIVPKSHVLNFADLYNDAEFGKLAATVVRRLRAYGSRIHMLEHGSNCEGSSTGCGVDHAHVHFVPLPDDLSSEIDRLDSSLRWTEISLDSVRSVVGTAEYLLYCADVQDELTIGRLALLESPLSQFFRRAIAVQLKVAMRFDYRTYGFDKNIAKTYDMFGNVEDTNSRLLNPNEVCAIAV